VIRNGTAEGNTWQYTTAPPRDGTHLTGTVYTQLAPGAGRPMGWVCTGGGTPAIWMPVNTQAGAVAKASDYTITSADIGTRFSNAGAATVAPSNGARATWKKD
jgi:hypothetical protein